MGKPSHLFTYYLPIFVLYSINNKDIETNNSGFDLNNREKSNKSMKSSMNPNRRIMTISIDQSFEEIKKILAKRA